MEDKGLTITAIKAQARRSGRVSIYLNNSYAFSLTKNQLLEAKLAAGQVLDGHELKTLREFSDFGKLLERTLRFALVRPHSRYEMIQHLRRKNVAAEDQTKLLTYLAQRGYIDDSAFAKAWVRSRLRTKPVSKRRLVAELRQKGVDELHIKAALQEEPANDRQALRELIQKKQRQARYKDEQKLIASLLRQGFDYGAVKTALADFQQADGSPG